MVISVARSRGLYEDWPLAGVKSPPSSFPDSSNTSSSFRLAGVDRLDYHYHPTNRGFNEIPGCVDVVGRTGRRETHREPTMSQMGHYRR
jgi:hypothetical protein